VALLVVCTEWGAVAETEGGVAAGVLPASLLTRKSAGDPGFWAGLLARAVGLPPRPEPAAT
jgi:hypothetical protein